MSDPIPPDAARRLAAELRRLRGDTPLRELARTTHIHHSALWRFEQGVRIPPRDTAARLDGALGAGGEVISLREYAVEERKWASRGGDTGNDDDMERRSLIQAAAVGVGLSALETPERVRRLLTMDTGDDGRPVDEWERTCEDLRYGLCVWPAARFRDAVEIELAALVRQRHRAAAAERLDLLRVQAALGLLYANVLGRLSEHDAALRWWRTARAAADACRDPYLGVAVRAEEAAHGLYGQRPMASVMRLTQEACDHAKGVPSWSLVFALCARARAATVLQRHDEARDALRQAEALVQGPRLPAASVMPSYWRDGRPTQWTGSLVHAGAGDEDRAAEVRKLVSAHRDYQYRAAAQLHAALCTVANGGIKEGLEEATRVFDDIPAAHRTNTVRHTGLILLRAVPEEHRDSPAAADFRAVLGDREASRTA
ncbi:helix-turn-helix transcriptional regulator [Spongiactinospora sp. TRM90649]|uniref:helix-turn-helix transcriptional regulator n=1 Tax=Spongiactinospora sp. TRM90649 TaxID=3031114 RepID=UPI0023F76D9B|nr:helix-turn-helix transcriptional regulator [Spongiactinospora sp. TRM90649]MDF5758185.1 helix-turn-helix transcriptional regulator [Spongiactinospora sp. TRM90649]